jgi:hypothetical protein
MYLMDLDEPSPTTSSPISPAWPPPPPAPSAPRLRQHLTHCAILRQRYDTGAACYWEIYGAGLSG